MSQPEESGLERDYCAGQFSLREMAKIYGISEAAIRKRAKKHGWVRSEKTGTQPGTQVRKKGTQKERVRTEPKAPEKKSDSDASEEGEELSIDPDEYGISRQQAWFAYWFVKTRCRVEAYRLAEFEGEGNTAYVGASRLYRKDKVQRAIRDLEKRVAKRYQVEFDDLVNQLVSIINADPNALSQYRRVNCRHCWGDGNKYQWRDLDEQLQAEKRAESDDKAPPDFSGGIGFVENMDPNPDCPRCNGEGIGETFFAETRDLEGDERYLYAGVKESKFGIEILMEDKKTARAQLIKILNMQQSKVANGNRPAVNNYSPEDYRAAVRSLNDEFEDLDE